MHYKSLAVKLPTNLPNHPQTSQTTHKPVKLPPNQSQISQHYTKNEETLNGKVNFLCSANHPQTSHKHDILSRKSVCYVTKYLRDNAKHVLSLQPFYAVTLTISSEDQSQAGIEGKLSEIISKVAW